MNNQRSQEPLRGKKILIGVGVLVLIGIMYVSFGGINGNIVATEMIEDEDVIKISLAGIDEIAQFLDYNGIKFFVVRANDGSVRTAFDACDVCYNSRKGYRQEGDDMICNNCGNHYRISGLGTANLKGGGCWPGYLPATVEGEYLVITKVGLESGRYRF